MKLGLKKKNVVKKTSTKEKYDMQKEFTDTDYT